MADHVRRLFMEVVRKEGLKHFDKKDVERVLREDKWIERCLQQSSGDVFGAVRQLKAMCDWRMENQVNKVSQGENLDEYKRAIREHGKDKAGNPLLVINITEISKFFELSTDPIRSTGNLMIRWFEELDSRKVVKNISIVCYHGESKFMGNINFFLNLICRISDGYISFLDTIYVFEDVLSFEIACALALRILFLNTPDVKYVNQNNCKDLINLDLPAYERENLSAPLKTKKSESTQSEAVPKNTNAKERKKQTSEITKIENVSKDGNSKDVLGNIGGTESEEVGDEVIGEDNNNEDTKEVVKKVLKRLQELQLEINVVIKEVMNLL